MLLFIFALEIAFFSILTLSFFLQSFCVLFLKYALIFLFPGVTVPILYFRISLTSSLVSSFFHFLYSSLNILLLIYELTQSLSFIPPFFIYCYNIEYHKKDIAQIYLIHAIPIFSSLYFYCLARLVSKAAISGFPRTFIKSSASTPSGTAIMFAA